MTDIGTTAPASVEEFVWRTLFSSIDVIAQHESIGQDSMDPEALHQFRVSIRRLRSNLRSLRRVLNAAAATDLRNRLAELDELVRPVRDGEVIVERLSRTAGEVSNPIDADVVEWIHQRLSDETERARTILLEAFRGPVFAHLVQDLQELRSSRLVMPPAGELEAVLQELNERAWGKVARLARSLPEAAADQDLHRLRILAKRSRYLSEASSPVLGKPAEQRAKAAQSIQTLLGEHQDSVVLSAVLAELPRPTAAHGIATDGLLAAETDARVRLRKQWHRLWRRIDRRVH